MADEMIVKELDQVVVRFSGDSGDGMQLAGNIFSNISATVGNDISTFPDYPADIRAPQGSLTGVSGFQVHIGAGKVFTPGDKCDVLVAMNAAALKTQYKFAKSTACIIIDTDCFQKSDLDKAAFKTDNPIEEMGIKQDVIAAPISQMVKDCLADTGMDNMVARVAARQESERELAQVLGQGDAPFGAHFVGTPEIGAVSRAFGQCHGRHVEGQYPEDRPQPCGVERRAAAVAGPENDIHRLNREAERHDVDQVGEHREADRFTETLRMADRNILDCIHRLPPFWSFRACLRATMHNSSFSRRYTAISANPAAASSVSSRSAEYTLIPSMRLVHISFAGSLISLHSRNLPPVLSTRATSANASGRSSQK